MKMTLKKTWTLPDLVYKGDLPSYITGLSIVSKPVKDRRWREDLELHVPAGTYEIERIRCPTGYDCNWLVIKGTMVGGAEGYMRDWTNGIILDNPSHKNHGKPSDWGDSEIVIED